MENLFTETDRSYIKKIKKDVEDFFYTKLPAPISERAILAGGAFASMWHKEAPRDYDLFILDTPENNRWYQDEHGFGLISTERIYGEYLGNSKTHVKAIYHIAKDRASYYGEGIKSQIIFTKCKTREELVNSFDYWHTKVSFSRNYKNWGVCMKEGTLHISPQALEAIKTRTLVPTKKFVPHEERREKLISRGWKEQVIASPVMPTVNTTITGIAVTSAGNGYIGTLPGSVPGSVYIGTVGGGGGTTTSSVWHSLDDVYKTLETEKLKKEVEELKRQMLIEPYQKAYNTQIKEALEEKLGPAKPIKTETWLDVFSARLKKPWDSY